MHTLGTIAAAMSIFTASSVGARNVITLTVESGGQYAHIADAVGQSASLAVVNSLFCGQLAACRVSDGTDPDKGETAQRPRGFGIPTEPEPKGAMRS